MSAAQRQSQQQAEAQRTGAAASSATVGTATNPVQPGVVAPAAQLPPPVTATEPPRDPVADAEKALAFKARFASNLVSADDGAAHPTAESADASDGYAARSASLDAGPAVQARLRPRTGSKRAPEVNVNSAHGQPFVVFEGTTIDTALVNRLDGEFAGPVKVMVTNPVYSQDRQHVLSRKARSSWAMCRRSPALGQKRLAVTFHRLLMPDGYSVDLDQFHGLDQAGRPGLKDKVNNHYLANLRRVDCSGHDSGAAEATTNRATTNRARRLQQGIASSLVASSANVLDRFINIPPTITIREGHRIKVYITQDMLLPAYENHDMPGVM